MASVLSTMSGIPASCAIPATFSRSTTMPPGLARFSTKIAFERGVPHPLQPEETARSDEEPDAAERTGETAVCGAETAIRSAGEQRMRECESDPRAESS